MAQQQKPPTQAIARQQPTGALAPQNPLALLRTKFDASRYNVLAPVTHFEELPPMTRLIVTEVKINPDPKEREVFPIAGGAKLIGKPGLDRIGNAAGISWTAERRQDNGRHPHYCEMFVEGRITDFDGTVRTITGVKSIDLREDAGGGEMGKDYSEIVTKAAKASPPRDPSNQLMEARKFIQEIAASKAKNRAIASALGIKRSYTDAELAKPFIVPKLSIDTSHADVAQVLVANMLGATQALYGARATESKVVDASFEEAPAGEAAVEAEQQPQPEPTGAPADMARLTSLWLKCRDLGMDGPSFKELCRASTGKERKEDFTSADVDQISAAVEAFTANSDMPV